MLGSFELNRLLTLYARKIIRDKNAKHALALLKKIKRQYRSDFLKFFHASKAQLLQDLFVLSELDFKENGFFVEFGATNGIDLSNTYLLETEFNWKGILAEPARSWHSDIKRNRTSIVETKCVWDVSNETLKFNETTRGEFSTIDAFSSSDHHSVTREDGRVYEVETISLLDLLELHDAPSEIDYLSIDTEGSEYDILKKFDFGRFRFKVISCEHNYTKQREKIHDLLAGHGYARKFEKLSQFDDWYVAL